MVFFPFSPSGEALLALLALDRTAIHETMPRMYFRVVRNDDLRVGEITR